MSVKPVRMRAALEEFNKLDKSVREKCVLLSVDVKSLYPSMQWDDIVTAVKEMIINSDSDMVPADVIDQEGLVNVVPKRKKNRTRHITINYLRRKKNNDNWTIPRKPGSRQKKKLLALAISAGVRLVMVGDQCYLQTGGGSIGLELTGAVSRPFMARWDRIYLQKVKKAGMKMEMYERYVDDSNQLSETAPPNTVYNVLTGKLAKDDNLNLNETPEERTVRVLLSIANSVQNGIIMDADYPGKNDDRKLPILDMKVWLNDDKLAVYQHYERNSVKQTGDTCSICTIS